MRVLAVFGPTGVGKTAVAIAVADRLRERGEDPVAVSADSMQIYEGLPILTGAADAQEQAELEHRLLGFVPIDQTYSAGAFAQHAHEEIDGLIAANRRPIVVGGTGLYLRAALAKLDLRPPVDPSIRERRRTQLAQRGAPALHAELQQRAPKAAAAIEPTDAQRVTRAIGIVMGHDDAGGVFHDRAATRIFRHDGVRIFRAKALDHRRPAVGPVKRAHPGVGLPLRCRQLRKRAAEMVFMQDNGAGPAPQKVGYP